MSSDKFHQRLPKYRYLAAILILATIAVCSVEQIWYVHWGGDPRVFVHAARLLLSGEDLINIPNHYGLYYVYPPFFAFLNIPLVLLPIEIVIVLWTIASVALLGWSMTAFYAGMAGRPFFSLPAKTRWVVFFFTLLLTARFIFFRHVAIRFCRFLRGNLAYSTPATSASGASRRMRAMIRATRCGGTDVKITTLSGLVAICFFNPV